MAELGLEGLKLIDTASRPDAGGSIGRRIMVQSNMFKVNSYSGKTKALRYHYDVTIKQVEEISAGQYRPIARQANDRDLPAKMQMRLLHDALTGALKRGEAGITAKHIEGAAFDGKKNIFTPVKFTFEEHTINMDVPGRGGSGPKRYFQISIREVGVADPNIIDLFCKRDRQTIQASSSSTVDGLALAIQSGEVALRHGPSMDENIKIFGASGRRFFRLNDAVPISDGAEILKGFFQSLRPTQSGLMLNLDVAYSCFLTSGPFLEVAAKVLNFGGHGGGGGGRGGRGFDRGRGGRGGRGGGFDRGRGGGYRGGPQYGGGGGATVITSMQPADCQVLRKALNGVMIKPMHRDGAKAEKFTGFTPQSASRSVFKVKDSTTNKEYDTTVVEYFRTKFNRQLRYPDLPCAVLKGKTFIPLEFCEVLGGTPIPLQRMKPAMTQDMIRQSALKPSARRDRNMQIRLENAYEGSGLLRQFDMNIVNDLTQTEARVLPSPTVIYGDNRKIQPRDGSWNLAGMKFIASGDPLQTIVLLNCARRSEQDCRQFASTQLAACQRVGMNVLRTSTIHYAVCQVDPSKVREAMSEAGRTAYYTGGKRKPPQLYVIFLDEQNLQFYETIKRVAALELATPVATQCVNVTKAMPRDERKQSQYCANVAMKINIKLGGTNQAVAALPKVGADCMLIGVDVTHPPPGMRIKLPSIIASVATIDGNRNRYNSELGAQYNKDERRKAQEAILDGAAIYTRHLSSWQERNSGRLPASIVVFRDGVSEGEYEHVVTFEVDTLKKVCLQMKPGYNPKVTFIVCGKRHHVRFYATDRRDVDRSENLPAGTVVDRTVVHPYTFDFYLQTQAGLVGTARPAHYQVIKDEIKFSSDELQTLLNNLTYTYARATRSVSLPPMVMYAHFLAEKGRALIYGADGTYSDVASTMSGDSGGGEPTAHADLTNIWQKLQRSPAQGDTAFGKTLWYM